MLPFDPGVRHFVMSSELDPSSSWPRVAAHGALDAVPGRWRSAPPNRERWPRPNGTAQRRPRVARYSTFSVSTDPSKTIILQLIKTYTLKNRKLSLWYWSWIAESQYRTLNSQYSTVQNTWKLKIYFANNGSNKLVLLRFFYFAWTERLRRASRLQFTWASSWGGGWRCGRTSSWCSWWHVGGGGRSTCGRSSCRSCTSGPTRGARARWRHHGGATPSEGSTPSGCCSQTRCVRPPAACRRRSNAADLGGCPLCPCFEVKF